MTSFEGGMISQTNGTTEGAAHRGHRKLAHRTRQEKTGAPVTTISRLPYPQRDARMCLRGGAPACQKSRPIEKYVRDAHVQKHISFPFPSRFKVAEALAGFKRKVPPFVGAN